MLYLSLCLSLLCCFISPASIFRHFFFSLPTCLACCVGVPQSHGAKRLCSSRRWQRRQLRPACPKASVVDVLGVLSQPAHVETPRQVRVHAAAAAKAAEKSGRGQGGPVAFHLHLLVGSVRSLTLVTSCLLSPPPDAVHVQQGEDRAADAAPQRRLVQAAHPVHPSVHVWWSSGGQEGERRVDREEDETYKPTLIASVFFLSIFRCVPWSLDSQVSKLKLLP